MHFHPELGPPPTVGLEYEVTKFKRNSSYLTVAKGLLKRGMTRPTYAQKRHEWHHTCQDCIDIGSKLFFPVLWKSERDASLPVDGCEFISSPFPAADMFVESAVTALNEITDRAVWTNDLPKQRDNGLAESGFHVHVHSQGPELASDGQFGRFMQTMYYFLPEMFLLSQSTNVERSLAYRLPSNDVRNHHSWLAFPQELGQRGPSGPKNRVEWRIWEAPTDDLAYLEGAIYLSAALTQLAYKKDVLDDMEKVGLLTSWSRENLSLDGILAEADKKKLQFLRKIALNATHLTEDDRGSESVEQLFQRVM